MFIVLGSKHLESARPWGQERGGEECGGRWDTEGLAVALALLLISSYRRESSRSFSERHKCELPINPETRPFEDRVEISSPFLKPNLMTLYQKKKRCKLHKDSTRISLNSEFPGSPFNSIITTSSCLSILLN